LAKDGALTEKGVFVAELLLHAFAIVVCLLDLGGAALLSKVTSVEGVRGLSVDVSEGVVSGDVKNGEEAGSDGSAEGDLTATTGAGDGSAHVLLDLLALGVGFVDLGVSVKELVGAALDGVGTVSGGFNS
jgi:hypothetical protein